MTTVKSLSRYFYCNNFDPQVNSSYLPPRPTVKNEGTRTEKPGLARRCWSRDDTPAAGIKVHDLPFVNTADSVTVRRVAATAHDSARLPGTQHVPGPHEMTPVATTLLIRVLRTLDGMSVLHLDAESQTIQDPLCLASPFLLAMLFTYSLSVHNPLSKHRRLDDRALRGGVWLFISIY